MFAVTVRRLDRCHAVHRTMQIDGREHAMSGCAANRASHGRIARIAGDVAGPVPVRMNDDIDKIRIVERDRPFDRRSRHRTPRSATTSSTATGISRGASRSGRCGRVRCENNTDTRAAPPVPDRPACGNSRCPECCSRCNSQGPPPAPATTPKPHRRRGRPNHIRPAPPSECEAHPSIPADPDQGPPVRRTAACPPTGIGCRHSRAARERWCGSPPR